MTIFDLMTSENLAAYWNELTQDEAPYPCEELFPDDKKMGLDLKWLKGAKGLPVVLKLSAFDVHAIPRERIGFDKLYAEMPFLKESTYIDEELRQQLNMVLETGNQAYIDSVMNRVFDDETRLLRGARARREQMRMMALTTGVISMASNGQSFYYDYGVAASQKGNAVASWSDTTNSDPIEDLRLAQEAIYDATGVKPTRGMIDKAAWKNLRNNERIKKEIYVLSNGVGAITDAKVADYISTQLDGLVLVVNSKRFINDAGQRVDFMPANTVVLFPDGDLGKTWFGTTPEESDLMTSGVANVSIVDTGVAITTMRKTDPVNVETKVTMICLPSFEMADHIFILSTVAA
jgi:hypothetical protein